MEIDGIDEYSERVQSAILEIAGGDGGFHSQAMAAALPFYDMLEQGEDGTLSVSPSAEVSIGGGSIDFDVTLRKSDEEKAWFFTVSFGTERFDGVLRFNAIYNARGAFSFAFLNDAEVSDYEDITQAIPYITFFAMVK